MRVVTCHDGDVESNGCREAILHIRRIDPQTPQVLTPLLALPTDKTGALNTGSAPFCGSVPTVGLGLTGNTQRWSVPVLNGS